MKFERHYLIKELFSALVGWIWYSVYSLYRTIKLKRDAEISNDALGHRIALESKD